MPEDLDQIRDEEDALTMDVLILCFILLLVFIVLSLTSCTSPDRQWRESQRVLEVTQR